MEGQKFHFSGIPTGPDVEKLIKAFPIESLKQGTMIPYGSISDILKKEPDSSRFRCVTWNWRKRMRRNHNIEIDTISGVGFVIANNSQRVSNGSSMMKSAAKKFRKSGDLMARTSDEGLSEEEKRTKDMVIRASGTVLTLIAAERKKQPFQITSISDGKRAEAA